MADTYTERKHTSLLGNIGNSIVGALIGLLLFVGSFFVLWINEGRLDLSTIAKRSVPLNAATYQSALDGKFVAAAGVMQTNERVGDGSYLKPGSYLRLERKVEMYAWDEKSESRTVKNVGGSSDTETVYTYTKEWTTSPENSGSFKQSSGHSNPEMPIKGTTFTANNIAVGAYTVDPNGLEFPSPQALALNSEDVGNVDGYQQSGDYLINHPRALSNPQVGDVRISYLALPNNLDVTVFGKAEQQRIVPYVEGKATLYRAFAEGREAAIATYHTEYTILLWVLRLAGFLMMWFGLMLVSGPLNAVLDILPIAGNIGRFAGCLVTLPLALVLSLVTILVGIIAHNLILLVITTLLVVGGFVLWNKRRRGLPPTAASAT